MHALQTQNCRILKNFFSEQLSFKFMEHHFLIQHPIILLHAWLRPKFTAQLKYPSAFYLFTISPEQTIFSVVMHKKPYRFLEHKATKAELKAILK